MPGRRAIPIRPLAALLNEALPQTQCTRCGYPDCAAYAHAMADEGEAINRCPPGGEEGMRRLAHLTGRATSPLNENECGAEGPRLMARIDEDWCIGCTLCIKACPVDAIVGAAKQMHSILQAHCTGCELCVPACPVDCIAMDIATLGRSGWAAWSSEQAASASERYAWHQLRVARELSENDERLAAKAAAKLAGLVQASQAVATADPDDEEARAIARKRAVIEAALQRAREKKAAQSAQ